MAKKPATPTAPSKAALKPKARSKAAAKPSPRSKAAATAAPEQSVHPTPQQVAYVDAWLKGWNKTEAARTAGYSSAKTNITSIHNARGVQFEISRRLAAARDWNPMTEAYVVSGLQEIAERCMQARVITDADGKPIMVPHDDGEMAMLCAFQPTQAISAFEKLGRHVGMWKEDSAADPSSISLEAFIASRNGGREVVVESAPVIMPPDQPRRPH